MKVFRREPIDLVHVVVPEGQLYLIPSRCKECHLCVEFCPKEVLQVSSAVNEKGYHLPELAPGKETACVRCDFCTIVCPEFAIFSREVVA